METNPKANALKLAAVALSAALFASPAFPAQDLTVRSVALLRSSGQPQIEVKTSGPVSPATQAVVGPDRIVVDFPGALPASTLHALAVHRGGLKAVRFGLFQSQPPITRVVLDVDAPTDYQVVPMGNSIIIKLGRPDLANQPNLGNKPDLTHQAVTEKPVPVAAAMAAAVPSPARIVRSAALLPALQVVNTVATPPVVANAAPVPPRPRVDVGVHSNLLSIRAQGATLAEVLYEVHRRTGADIAIPAGAEQERVVVNLPPAPGRDTIASLLNGSRFNYIVLGADTDPGGFRNILLSVKEGGSSGVFVHNDAPPPGVPPQPVAQEPALDPSQLDPGGIAVPGPELEPIPEDTSANEPETSPDNPRPPSSQQPTIQNIPEAGQVPQ